MFFFRLTHLYYKFPGSRLTEHVCLCLATFLYRDKKQATVCVTCAPVSQVESVQICSSWPRRYPQNFRNNLSTFFAFNCKRLRVFFLGPQESRKFQHIRKYILNFNRFSWVWLFWRNKNRYQLKFFAKIKKKDLTCEFTLFLPIWILQSLNRERLVRLKNNCLKNFTRVFFQTPTAPR